MFNPVFTTTVPYRLPADSTLRGTTYPTPYAPAVTHFTTPPRTYGEEWQLVNAFFVQPEDTATSTTALVMNVQAYNIYGFENYTMRVNPITGEVIARGPYIGAGTSDGVVVDNAGTLWEVQFGGGNLHELAPGTFEVVRTIPASFFETPPQQTSGGIAAPMIDQTRNLILMSDPLQNVDGMAINQFKFSTGGFIRRFELGGPVQQILQEGDQYCFIFCSTGIMYLFDFVAWKIISTLRAPGGSFATAFSVQYAYDRSLRRLYALNINLPDTNGASRNVIRGYYPVPIATNLTKAIPMTPPRKYRTTPYLTRLVGDAGEPVGGARVEAALIGGANVGGAQVTDHRGETYLPILGTAEGTITIDLEATI